METFKNLIHKGGENQKEMVRLNEVELSLPSIIRLLIAPKQDVVIRT
jgi:hypothetical protein